MLRSWHGRASLGLTLLLAGLLASRMIGIEAVQTRKEPPTPPVGPIKAEASKPKAAPVSPATIYLPPPPQPPVKTAAHSPAQKKPAVEPKIESLRKTPPPLKAPPPVTLKPLTPEPSSASRQVSLTPLTPKPRRNLPKTVKPQTAAPVKTAPTAKSAPGSKPEPVSHPGVHAAAKGRVLLRVLEHGKGPAIEIAWPSRRGSRRHLTRLLQRCYGMELALMDGQGRLYADQGRRGQIWRPNLDLYSGFVRHTSGVLPESERRAEAAIRARHGRRGDLVHIFPRRVDALLLGGIRNLAGASYGQASSIRARYEVRNRRVLVSGIDIDGQTTRGAIDLGAAAHCRGGTS